MNLDRRMFLAATSAAMTASLIPGAANAERKGFFARINRPVGLQLYTLGDEVAKDLDSMLARVAAIGYRDIELPNLLGRTPQELKAAADRAGLTLSCIHLAGAPLFGSGASLSDSPAQIADMVGALGIRNVVMPIMLLPQPFAPKPGEDFLKAIVRAVSEAGPDLWKQTAGFLNEKAAILKPLGISLGYHNHDLEFAPLGKTSGWDILARETDPGLVSFELDLGWLGAAGIDPVRFLKRHSGRVRQVHVKDVKATSRTPYALSMDPTEVGAGKLDWKRILPAAHKAGVLHFYVEQEPPFAMARIEAITKSHGFLSKLVA